MPDGVTNIGKNAFYNDPYINNVYYGGTENAWKGIDIAKGNDFLTCDIIH